MKRAMANVEMQQNRLSEMERKVARDEMSSIKDEMKKLNFSIARILEMKSDRKGRLEEDGDIESKNLEIAKEWNAMHEEQNLISEMNPKMNGKDSSVSYFGKIPKNLEPLDDFMSITPAVITASSSKKNERVAKKEDGELQAPIVEELKESLEVQSEPEVVNSKKLEFQKAMRLEAESLLKTKQPKSQSSQQQQQEHVSEITPASPKSQENGGKPLTKNPSYSAADIASG
uniref:Uncharacterized protein n=1 Tax=Timspurckia oligopyrenoides TaxID=708627 RepID=A0A7S1ETJ4_9RHOD